MRMTIQQISEMKTRGEKIAMITAYDYTSARAVEEAGVPVVLVGDSLGQVMLGYDSTVPVTMDEMLHHVKAVVRGIRRAHVVADMPFLSYQAGQDDAIRNAGRFLKEGGAQSVKVEGGRQIAGTVQRMVETGIPVMAHIGLTPQFINQLGGYKVQGKSSKEAIKLMEDARALEEAGAYSIVLELIPAELSRLITERVAIPTIGIGAGPHCDGQVQVFHDLMGLFPDFHPRHAGKYADLAGTVTSAVARYVEDVRQQAFPTDAQSFTMDESVLQELEGEPAVDRG